MAKSSLIHGQYDSGVGSSGGGGGEVKEVALLSITTAPTGEFAKGSKYYNVTDKKIYTAVVADSWDGATVEVPQFATYYIYNNTTYVWDGNSLEEYDLENFVKKTDIVNDLTTDDATKVLSAKQGKVLNEKVDLKQNITDNNLTTSNKTIVESINEIKAKIDTKSPIPEEITDLTSTFQDFDNANKLKTNANYNFGELDYLTFQYGSVDTSPFGTAIRFSSGTTPTILSDNTSIDWVDGHAPVPATNKTCLILIFNKMGFYKEW